MTEPAAVTEVSAPPRHIVLAEDDEDMRALISWVLKADGFRITEVSDGRALLDYLFRTREHVDLVITDVHMPKLSGLDVLDACRAQSRFLPTLLITAYGDEYTRAAASRFGAIAVIDKPLDLDDLRSVVALLTGVTTLP
jgi:DNA-binding NtrC family response regulator